MKKTWKAIAALTMAGAMTMSMSFTAFASGAGTDPAPTETPAATTTYAISVDTSNNAATHTYEVYQIFTGTPSNGQLVDVRYGASAGQLGTAGELVPGDVLDAIEDAADARAWVEANKDKLGSPVETLNGETTSYNAVPGWYVVLDTDYTYPDPRTEEDTDAYSAYMVEVVDQATTITPKNAAPTVDKEVQDDEGTEWGEAADHDIGESFQFRLTATLPADINYAVYDAYPITFNDTMSAGVTFESIASVTVDGQAMTSGYTCTATAGQAGGSWELTIPDVKTVAGVDFSDGGDVIVVYNAHLNTNAIVHQASASDTNTNNNKVSLTYNNNPDATGGSDTDTTPEDYVWVFTYNVTNTKVDADGNGVAGAGFTLKDSTGAAISLYKVGTTYYKYDSAKTDYPTGGSVVTEMLTEAGAGNNAFDIVGLDVGTYTLTETTVPDGYNQCADLTIEIEATHAENASLASADLTLTKANNVSNEIVNQSGATLPETGGMGTTIFYIVGAVLVIGAGVLLVTRRRMSSK